MTSQGSPYTIFRRALERGSLTGVGVAVASLPGPPPLDDALVICRLLLDHAVMRRPRPSANSDVGLRRLATRIASAGRG